MIPKENPDMEIDPRDRWFVQQFGEEGRLFATTQGCMHPEIAAELKSEPPSSKAPKAQDSDLPADSQAA
jgi:hypothetical protein